MSSLFFFPHLGLGDHIICHGIVVELLKDHDKIIMPVKKHNVKSVDFLCKNLNVSIVPVDNDSHAEELARQFSGKSVALGWRGRNFLKNQSSFSKSFYEQAEVSFNKAWDNFKIQRDTEREKKLYQQLVTQKPFAFVHDDTDRGLVAHQLHTSLPIVRPDHNLSETIFDYCHIIEKAQELHLIDSSFALLADRLDISKAKRKAIHRYVRMDHSKGGQRKMPTEYKQAWEYIL